MWADVPLESALGDAVTAALMEWSEWQDLNLRPLVPNEALDHRTRYGNSAYAPCASRHVKLLPVRGMYPPKKAGCRR